MRIKVKAQAGLSGYGLWTLPRSLGAGWGWLVVGEGTEDGAFCEIKSRKGPSSW